MKVVPFIAENAAEALAKIHTELGPDAVVLSVRPVPNQGLARLWQKHRSVEVVAAIMEETDLAGPPAERSGGARSLFQTPRNLQTNGSPPALNDGTSRPHVLIGPPGVGKTTLLCKWMAYSVLNENLTARIWRLDGATANTAEFLNVYGEMLAVSVERFWGATAIGADLCLIDLPGVAAADREGLRALKEQLAGLPSPRIHLVLNAAYDSAVLIDQAKTFAVFEPEDVSFCHLDEVKSQDKLAEFLLGTNCYLRFLSTGQKIPGDFALAGQPIPVCAAFGR